MQPTIFRRQQVRSADSLMDPHERLLATVWRRKLAWLGHVTRHDSLSETIGQGTLKDGRRHGRLRKCIKEWTSIPTAELLSKASCRKDWKKISAESSLTNLRQEARSAPLWVHRNVFWQLLGDGNRSRD